MNAPGGRPRDALSNVIEPAFQGILRHPFVTGLTDGRSHRGLRSLSRTELPVPRRVRSRAGATRARGGEAGDVEFFARRAAFALAGERDFVERLAAELDLPHETLRPAEPSPTCLGYSSFVKQAVAYGDYRAGLGAGLPCYLLYWETSKALAHTGSRDPRYQRWIDMYVDPSFEEGVLGAFGGRPRLRGRRRRDAQSVAVNAVISARYEWLFWEPAYRGDEWPDLS